MAKLHSDPYPMPDYTPLAMNTYIQESEKALNAIPTDKLYYEPFADGQAYYYVVSFSPLVLQHVPYLDAWRLSDSRIKALSVKAVRRNIENHQFMQIIFGGE